MKIMTFLGNDYSTPMDSAIFGGDEGATVGENDESVLLHGGVEGVIGGDWGWLREEFSWDWDGVLVG